MFGFRHRDTVCANSGENGNIFYSRKLRRIIDAGVELEIEVLPNPRLFDIAAHTMEGKKSILVCDRTIYIDCELHIRHGTLLMLRNLKWLVTEQKFPEPILERPILEAFGLHTRELLVAAADRLSGSVDAQNLLETLVADV